MLFARGELKIDDATFYRSHLTLEGRAMMLAVERAQMVADTRVIPASRGKGELGMVYFVLDGWMEWHGGPRFEAPAALVLRVGDYDGARGQRPRTFRSGGVPYRALEIRLLAPHADVTGPTAFTPSDELWTAARAHVETALRGPTDVCPESATRVFEELARIGRAPSLPKPREDDATLHRVWAQIARYYGRVDVSPSLKEIASGSGLSLRQLSRVLVTLVRDFPVVGASWRELVLSTRIKMALMLLSLPDLSVTEVARIVGYSNVEALANAFQRAGAPRPRDARALVTGEPS